MKKEEAWLKLIAQIVKYLIYSLKKEKIDYCFLISNYYYLRKINILINYN